MLRCYIIIFLISCVFGDKVSYRTETTLKYSDDWHLDIECLNKKFNEITVSRYTLVQWTYKLEQEEYEVENMCTRGFPCRGSNRDEWRRRFDDCPNYIRVTMINPDSMKIFMSTDTNFKNLDFPRWKYHMLGFSSSNSEMRNKEEMLREQYNEEESKMYNKRLGLFHYDGDEFVLLHDNKTLFGCRYANGEVTMTGDDNLIMEHMTEIDAFYSKAHGHKYVCSFTIRRVKALHDYFSKNSMVSQPSSMILKRANGSVLKQWRYWNEKNSPIIDESKYELKKYARKCDTSIFRKSKEVLDDMELLHVHFSQDYGIGQINCFDEKYQKMPQIGRSNFMVSLNASDSSEVFPLAAHDSIQCEKGYWEISNYEAHMYKYHTNSLWKNESFDLEYNTISCAVSLNMSCAKPSYIEGKCANCPSYEFYRYTDSGTSLKCEDDKWLINNEYHTNLTAFCGPDSKRVPQFFANINGRKEQLVDAKCFKDYDCRIKSKLIYTKCDEMECGELEVTEKSMACKDPDNYMLRVFVHNSENVLKGKTYNCDNSTGKWKDENGKEIDDYSQVICLENDELVTAKIFQWITDEISYEILAILGIPAIVVILWNCKNFAIRGERTKHPI